MEEDSLNEALGEGKNLGAWGTNGAQRLGMGAQKEIMHRRFKSFT